MTEIAVLLSTYNGAAYLDEQLRSLKEQTATNFMVFIRDDGSTDGTVNIIRRYCASDTKFVFLENSRNLGAARSFMQLLKEVEAQYYLFCDQDDIWLQDKICNSYTEIRSREKKHNPVLVYGDAIVVNSVLKPIAESFIKYSGIDPSLVNEEGYVLVTNISPGCTYIFNKKMRDLSLHYPADIPMHDWWMVLTAKKYGSLYFTGRADMLYRQHSSNVIGVQAASWRNRLNKIGDLGSTLRKQHMQYLFLKKQGFIKNPYLYILYKVKYIKKSWLL